MRFYNWNVLFDIRRLTELFDCNHFLVCQVNPHTNFVLSYMEKIAADDHIQHHTTSPFPKRREATQKLMRVAEFLRLNIRLSIQKLLQVDLLNIKITDVLHKMIIQQYTGILLLLLCGQRFLSFI